MPAPGDQHRPTAATANPFLDHPQHISEYTAAEIATLQSRLEKQLGPEFISTRSGPGGGKLHYLAADKVINLANEVFGFNGWSSSIQNVQIDFVDENTTSGKVSLGLSTIMRVTIRDGTFHEDIGYGHIENCKGKAAAFEKAKKEAATDALKRCMRNFGNVMGNCLYDKDFLQKISKVKALPTKLDTDRLHRHPDFEPIKQQPSKQLAIDSKPDTAPQRQVSVQSVDSFGSIEFDDDFGPNAFDDADLTHPDEVRLDDSVTKTPAQKAPSAPTRHGVSRMQSMPQIRPPNLQSPAPAPVSQGGPRMQPPQRPPHTESNQTRPPQAQPQQQNTPSRTSIIPASANTTASDGNENRSNPSSSTDSAVTGPQNKWPQTAQDPRPTTATASIPLPDSNEAGMPPPGHGFVTGRSADLLNLPAGSKPPNAALPFNPHAEATSIRRTHGMNPGKSAPVTRSSLQQANNSAGIGGVHGQQQYAPAVNQQHPQRPQSPAIGGTALHPNTIPARTNFVNPAADTSRRIGMPPTAAGLQNRNSYRPPTSVAPGIAGGGLKRPPLNDVSNLQMQQMDGATDVKKAKLDHAETTNTVSGANTAPANVEAGGEAR